MNEELGDYSVLKDRTILVVEDNETELDEYEELFNLYFQKCIIARNGKDGYEKFSKHHPDIVLTDLKMPIMDGLTMSQKIREINKEVPIILHTVFMNDDSLYELDKYKISSYIAKPTNVQNILKTLINELKKERFIVQSILEEFPDPMMILDLDKNILFANNLLKESRYWKEHKRMKCYEVLYGFDKPCSALGYKCESRLAIEHAQSVTRFHNNIDKLGNQTFYNIKTVPLKDEKGSIYAILKVIQDKSNDIFKEKRLKYQANYDVLTSLPNRMLLLDRIEQAINRSKRNKKMFAILFIDLDKFKIINDLYGHLVGDILLKKAAQRIKSSIREADTVARFGGDEFVVILEDIIDLQSIINIVKDIISKLQDEFLLEKDIKVQIGCSIGIEVYRYNDNKNIDKLIQNADKAMYKAKRSEKGKFEFYKECLDDN